MPTGSTFSYGIAADGSGNVFFADPTGLKLYELPSTATASTTATTIGAVASSSPFGIAVDTKGTVIVGQSGSAGTTITAFAPTTVGGTTYGSAQPITQASYYSGVYGLAFDASGQFWLGNSGSSADVSPNNTTSATAVSYSSTTPGATNTVSFAPVASTLSAVNGGGIATARGVAIDGANNVWIANDANASSGLYAVSEFTNAGVALSPTSYVSSTSENGGFQKAATVFAGLRGIAIDPSGNVWVSNTAVTSDNWVTEIVGAAVPVVTPISAALAANSLGTKP
jgi:hypothetical protein